MTTTEQRKFKLNSWKPELPDHRDRIYRPRAEPIPEHVASLAKQFRLHDQRMTNSCVGHGATTVLEVINDFDGDNLQLSRLFAYYTARAAIGEEKFDEGCYIRDAFRGFMKVGVPFEHNWRFKEIAVTKKPGAAAYKHAEENRQAFEATGISYESIGGLDGMLASIAAGQPVVFGFMVTNAIFGLNETNDVLPLPAPTEPPIGGHAVVADGYDLNDRMMFIQNSWGKAWGKDGYFRMPFDWFTDSRQLADDFWTARKTK